MGLLMGITSEGSTRVGEIQTDALKFVVSHVAYGTGGYDTGTPANALPLVPSATALSAEGFRKPVPLRQTTLDIIKAPRGTETTYTTVGGLEFSDVIGEAGLFATVTDPGTSGLATGYQFLLPQAHFPRVVLPIYMRFALKWPIQYFP